MRLASVLLCVCAGLIPAASPGPQAAETTVAGNAPDLTVDKRHTTVFRVGQLGTYTFVVTNLGTAETMGATTVLDTLPTGLSFVAAIGLGWSFAASGPVFSAVKAGSIAASDSASFTVEVNVGPEAYPFVMNAATVRSADDSDPLNDRDADPTVVESDATGAVRSNWGQLEARFREPAQPQGNR